MKKFIIVICIAVSMPGVARAATCLPGFITATDGTSVNADGSDCTVGASSGPAVNATTNAACPDGQTQDFQTGNCVSVSANGTVTQNAPPTSSAAQTSQSSGSSGFTALAPIPGLTDPANTSVVNSKSLANFFNNLYKYMIGLAATLAVIMIIWGGLEISTKDSVSKQTDGKERIYNAIFGLVLVLSPALVFSIINPGILNLSLNLPPLDIKSGSVTQAGGGAGTAPSSAVDTATGCTVNGTALFKKASCPSQTAARSFAAACDAAGGSGGVLGCQKKNSSGCTDTANFADCGTTSGSVTGPYVFIDTSQGGFSFSGILNGLIGYSNYEPLASTPDNPNNGSAVMQFVSDCTSGGGTVCLGSAIFSTACTYNSAQSTSQTNRCSKRTLTCVSSASSFYSTGTCSSNPRFTVIK